LPLKAAINSQLIAINCNQLVLKNNPQLILLTINSQLIAIKANHMSKAFKITPFSLKVDKTLQVWGGCITPLFIPSAAASFCSAKLKVNTNVTINDLPSITFSRHSKSRNLYFEIRDFECQNWFSQSELDR
jgi:hypothetical protein